MSEVCLVDMATATRGRKILYHCVFCERECTRRAIQCLDCGRFCHIDCVGFCESVLDVRVLDFVCRPCACDGGQDFSFNKSLIRLRTSRNKKKAAENENVLIETYFTPPSIKPYSANYESCSKEDAIALRQLQSADAALLQRYSPRQVVGDGNCFYRAVSLALFGTEYYQSYLRLCTALEMIKNPGTYSSDSPTLALRDLPIVTPEYRQLLRDTLTIGTYSEMIHVFALSNALGVPIQSYCPPTGSSLHPYTIYVHLSAFERTFRPSAVTVMWTSSSLTVREPNHIVLLVPCQPSTGLIPCNWQPADDSMAEDNMEEDSIADNANESIDETVPSPCTSLPFDDVHTQETETVEMSALDLTDGDPNCSEQMDESIHSRVTFEVIDKASNKGYTLLVDSRGFSYCKKVTRGNKVYWRCSLRTKSVVCKATVVQDGDIFTLGTHEHVHPPTAAVQTVRLVKKNVRAEAIANVFEPAGAIVDRVVTKLDAEQPLHAMPSTVNLARSANYQRRRLRPQDPQDLNFVLNTEYIPRDFLVEDVFVDEQRHLLFATPLQLQLLARAETWFIDGTFKVVKSPFVQLLSVHAFVRRDGAVKQIPLCYVVMSARRKRDYRAVFRTILRHVGRPVAVKAVFSDFEAALWRSVKHVLGDNVVHRGCVFHWTQAVWRKVQQLGLATAYMQRDAVHRYVRQLMALPFLPACDIVTAFDRIKQRAQSTKLLNLVEYVDTTWIHGTMWPPASWSVYRSTVRTNNDCEGWHARLNRKAVSGQLPLYKLLDLLHAESKLLAVTTKMLSERKVQRLQRKSSKNLQHRLFALWDEFDDGRRSTSSLLKACSHVYA